jgi:hypothetical protein
LGVDKLFAVGGGVAVDREIPGASREKRNLSGKSGRLHVGKTRHTLHELLLEPIGLVFGIALQGGINGDQQTEATSDAEPGRMNPTRFTKPPINLDGAVPRQQYSPPRRIL